MFSGLDVLCEADVWCGDTEVSYGTFNRRGGAWQSLQFLGVVGFLGIVNPEPDAWIPLAFSFVM